MEYLVLTSVVFAVAIGINSGSVYAQKHHKFYDQWRNGWALHSVIILPAWIAFIYLLVNLNNQYKIQFDSVPAVGYALLILAAILLVLAIREIGWQSLSNGNWFGRGKISRGSIFKFLKDPIYDSYFLAFTSGAFTSGNAAYFILAAESYIGLNLIESHVEDVKKGEKMSEEKLYQCPECGLHYTDKPTMEKCQAWCSKNRSCSLDITKLSIEVQAKKH